MAGNNNGRLTNAIGESLSPAAIKLTVPIWRTVFMSRSQAETAIAGYIDGFYNPVRRHSTLDFTSPVKFEAEAMQTV